MKRILIKDNNSLPKMAKRPQAAHIIKDNPTEPERCKTPPGLMKIPDPSTKKIKLDLFLNYMI
jgi:hypothetical protein